MKCVKCGKEIEKDSKYYDLCKFCSLEFDVRKLEEKVKQKG